MKVITKKVFYCEFCKKHRLTKSSMEYHEDRCFYNQKRSCTLCQDYEDVSFQITTINNSPDHMVDYEVRKIVVNDECPACILAFAYQNKVNAIYKRGEHGKEDWFNYKEARDKFLEDKNREEAGYLGY